MKKAEFLITGEGVTDFGWKENSTRLWHGGPVTYLINKCAEQAEYQIEFDFVERQDVDRIRLGRSLKELKGKSIPARKFQIYMKQNQYKQGIYYCDADREPGKNNSEKQAVRRFEDVYEEVDTGANPDPNHREIIPMVALHMIESWLLADLKAFENVYGKRAVERAGISLPHKPEVIWGDKRNPQSDYPKNFLKRICEQLSKFNKISFDKGLYVSLAENTDVNLLKEKCPVSFGRFAEDLREFLGMRV